MTMISQYMINRVDIYLGVCGRINCKSFLLIVLSDTIPFLHSHMPIFTVQVDSGLSAWRQ